VIRNNKSFTTTVTSKCYHSQENHHNFAWREEYEGQEVIVHRKGATPAAQAGLVDIVARFEPRLVKMAPDATKPTQKRGSKR